MLAWTALVDGWAANDAVVLLICDDPWLFRHFASRRGVATGSRPPSLWRAAIRLRLRGLAARAAVAVQVAWARLLTRRHRSAYPKGATAMLAYGHPASRSDGYDGYFGPLALEFVDLQRVLHVDCGPRRALALAREGRAFSLHAWGRYLDIAALPFARWRPRVGLTSGLGWLLRRAAEFEGGTGQAAMIRWQQLCHERFLAEARPRSVTWPWENHAWERHFVTACRRMGTLTIGFQHTPFGRQDFSFHPGSNPAGSANIPDRIVATGPACLEALEALGYPRDRMSIGGSLRFVGFRAPRFAPDGPVLVALPYHPIVAPQMVKLAVDLAATGRPVRVKPHPMAPAALAEIPDGLRTDTAFADQPAVSVVIFAASSIGLDALAGGIPAVRFLPEGVAALDPMPTGVAIQSASASGIAAALRAATVYPIDISMYYAPADRAVWRQILFGHL